MRAFFGPKILYRFLSQHFAKWFLSLYLGIGLIIFLIEAIELIRRFSARSSFGIESLAAMALLKVPTLLEKLFPFIVLMSVLLTLWLLGRKRETLACRLAGLSFWQLSLPFILATFAFKVVELAIINPIGANCLAFYERLESRAMSGLSESFSVSENGIWIKHIYDNHHAILRIAAIERLRLRTITLFEFNPNFDLVRQVQAEYGDFHDGELVLSEGQVLSLQGAKTRVQSIRIPSPLTLKTLMNSGRSPTSLSVWELSRFITILEKSGLSSARHRLHWYRLYAHGVLTLAMVLLALGCTFFRGKTHKPLHLSVIAIFVGLALFFIDDVTWALGVSGRLPLWFAAWSPALVALMLGVILLLNLEDA